MGSEGATYDGSAARGGKITGLVGVGAAYKPCVKRLLRLTPSRFRRRAPNFCLGGGAEATATGVARTPCGWHARGLGPRAKDFHKRCLFVEHVMRETYWRLRSGNIDVEGRRVHEREGLPQRDHQLRANGPLAPVRGPRTRHVGGGAHRTHCDARRSDADVFDASLAHVDRQDAGLNARARGGGEGTLHLQRVGLVPY